MSFLHWIIAGLALCLLEIFTPGFFVLLFGVSAILTGIATLLGLTPMFQWILYVLLCLMMLVFVRKYLVQMLNRQPTLTANVQGLIGKTALVTQEIEKDSLKGRVKVEGEDWIAITEEGLAFHSGEYVKVVGISGTKLIVRKES